MEREKAVRKVGLGSALTVKGLCAMGTVSLEFKGGASAGQRFAGIE
jgi:hypothetical protein